MMMRRKIQRKRKCRNYVVNIARLMVCLAIIGALFGMFYIMLQPDTADTFKGLITIPFVLFIIIAWCLFDILSDVRDRE